MTVWYPGPWEVRLFYTVTLSAIPVMHIQRLNCRVSGTHQPGDAFSAFGITQRNGVDVQADAAVTAWRLLLGATYTAATCTFNRAELWKYLDNSFESTFYSNLDINVAAGGASGAVDSGQKIFTFRTYAGHGMRVSLMEPGLSVGNPVLYTALGAVDKAIVDFLIGNTNWIWGRDNAYPAVFNRMFPGTNEATFKQRHRKNQ